MKDLTVKVKATACPDELRAIAFEHTYVICCGGSHGRVAPTPEAARMAFDAWASHGEPMADRAALERFARGAIEAALSKITFEFYDARRKAGRSWR